MVLHNSVAMSVSNVFAVLAVGPLSFLVVTCPVRLLAELRPSRTHGPSVCRKSELMGCSLWHFLLLVLAECTSLLTVLPAVDRAPVLLGMRTVACQLFLVWQCLYSCFAACTPSQARPSFSLLAFRVPPRPGRRCLVLRLARPPQALRGRIGP